MVAARIDSCRATRAVKALAGDRRFQVIVSVAGGERGGPWLVGGALRDYLLMKKPRGYDIVTTEPVARVVARLSRDCRQSFRMINRDWRMASTIWDEDEVTFSSLMPGESLEENLARRDYTANSLAFDVSTLFSPSSGGVLDVKGGVEDLRDGLLRPCTWDGLHADPSRVLRGIRFEVTCGLALVSMAEARIRAGKPRPLHAGDDEFWEEFLRLARLNEGEPLIRMARVGVLQQIVGFDWLPDLDELTLRLAELEALMAPFSWPRDAQRRRLIEFMASSGWLCRLMLALGLEAQDPVEVRAELSRRGARDSRITQAVEIVAHCASMRRRGYPWRDSVTANGDQEAVAAVILAVSGLVACRQGSARIPAGPEPELLLRRSFLRALGGW